MMMNIYGLDSKIAADLTEEEIEDVLTHIELSGNTVMVHTGDDMLRCLLSELGFVRGGNVWTRKADENAESLLSQTARALVDEGFAIACENTLPLN